MEHSREKGAHRPQSLEQSRRNPSLAPELPDAAVDNKRQNDCGGQIDPTGHREGASERVLDKTEGMVGNNNLEEGNTGDAAGAVDWRRRSMRRLIDDRTEKNHIDMPAAAADDIGIAAAPLGIPLLFCNFSFNERKFKIKKEKKKWEKWDVYCL
ncbi:hypothetical protein V6N12_022353 [Hibiscus sabdariffa]|uniref:Uncharacterized protein n=1 Tax=Hibiscus sabdariffa TaxID=183260 RepID=A0ABR2FUL0_9ROSI